MNSKDIPKIENYNDMLEEHQQDMNTSYANSLMDMIDDPEMPPCIVILPLQDEEGIDMAGITIPPGFSIAKVLGFLELAKQVLLGDRQDYER